MRRFVTSLTRQTVCTYANLDVIRFSKWIILKILISVQKLVLGARIGDVPGGKIRDGVILLRHKIAKFPLICIC